MRLGGGPRADSWQHGLSARDHRVLPSEPAGADPAADLPDPRCRDVCRRATRRRELGFDHDRRHPVGRHLRPARADRLELTPTPAPPGEGLGPAGWAAAGRRSRRGCCRALPTRRARAARRTAAAGERGTGSGLRAEVPTRAGARDRGAVNGDAGAAPRGRNHRGCPRRDSAAREVSCLMTGTYVRQATERSGRKVASPRRADGSGCLHPGSFPAWHRQKPANVAIRAPAPRPQITIRAWAQSCRNGGLGRGRPS